MNTTKPMHGTSKAKGCTHLEQGTFCKLFPGLKPWAEEFGIKDPCEAEEVAEIIGGVNGLMHDADLSSGDAEDIPAAYTFFAQFVDHDVTLDTTTALHGKPVAEDRLKKASCPMHKPFNPIPNLRSASLDLDCVYGLGPEASPYLYDEKQPGRLLIGNETNENDVPRNSIGTALIGDPRNDENIFVSQMQLVFLRFHNRLLMGRNFEKAQEEVRYHYQYLIYQDFLARVCNKEVYEYVVREIENHEYPKFSIVDEIGRICMPVEFSVAAYRFGHSLVRSLYPINTEHPSIELFDPIFNTLGFSAVPPELTVDWKYLLDVDPHHNFARCKAIDHLLTDELIRLPSPVVGAFASENDRSLAFRNVLRSYVMNLPSGQGVAKALSEKYPMINANQDIGLSKLFDDECISRRVEKKLETHTPLFLYILREAGYLEKGQRLGPVGSAILLEVFGSMLINCNSFLKKPNWKPDPHITSDPAGVKLTLADIVRYIQK